MVLDYIYYRMLLALRLATTMLEISSPFLIKGNYAGIGFFVDAEFSKIMIFDEGYEPKSHEAREYHDELAKIAKYYHGFTGAPSASLKRYGITRIVPDTTFPVLSRLASEFFQPLESPIYETLSASALNCILFMRAVTCVHEVVHAVFHSHDLVEIVGRARRGEAMVPEPIVEDFDPEAELGYALEYYFFGERPKFNGLPSDISGGVGVIWETLGATTVD
jgi:hypothetical protein